MGNVKNVSASWQEMSLRVWKRWFYGRFTCTLEYWSQCRVWDFETSGIEQHAKEDFSEVLLDWPEAFTQKSAKWQRETKKNLEAREASRATTYQLYACCDNRILQCSA